MPRARPQATPSPSALWQPLARGGGEAGVVVVVALARPPLTDLLLLGVVLLLKEKEFLEFRRSRKCRLNCTVQLRRGSAKVPGVRPSRGPCPPPPRRSARVRTTEAAAYKPLQKVGCFGRV